MKWKLPHLIPKGIRSRFSSWLHTKQRAIHAPKILRGIFDSSGNWRPRTCISDSVFIDYPDRVFIADNVFIGHYSILDGTSELVIDEGAQLAGWNGIYTHSSHIAIRLYGEHYLEVPAHLRKGYITGPVYIGRYAFIGAGAKVFPGVSIGKGALISAGAIVNRDVGEFEIVSGIPATVVGDTRNLDAQYLEDPELMQWYKKWVQL